MASAGGHWAKVAQGDIGKLVFVPAGKSTREVLTGIPVVKNTGFPATLGELMPVKDLGGSTGAKLMQDKAGNLYVMKKGAGELHLLEESAADNAYKAAGFLVADHKIYTGADGKPVKLAKYVEGETLEKVMGTNQAQAQVAIKNLQKGYAADALLANWDVVGLSKDNILIGKQGATYRIDNGGSLRFRAMGKTKGDAFGAIPNEIFSLRTGSNNKGIFDKLTLGAITSQIAGLAGRRNAIIATLPKAIRPIMEKRFDRLIQLNGIYKTLKSKGVDDSKIEGFTKKLWSGLSTGKIKFDPQTAADILDSFGSIGY